MKTQGWIILLVAVALAAGFAALGGFPDRPGEVPIQARYNAKIVYGTDQSLDREALRSHCAAQGGQFNECGNQCAPDAEACAAVCAFTCELASAPPPPPAGGGTTEVRIAVLDNEGTTGKQRGCDRVAFITRSVPETQAPLTAAMRELFGLTEENPEGHYNFMAKTNDTLSFERAEVADGTAKIYLSGRLSNLGGVCDDPRAQIQIEETALQFPTVQSVEIYLNGERTNLTPSQM